MPLTFTIGCDPEFFIQDRQTLGFVSAHNLFPGTKLSPFEVPKGAIQVDGTALELNITPAKTAEEFVSNIETVMADAESRLADTLRVNRFITTVKYSLPYFNRNIPDHAKELGCDPDFNAWTLQPNEPPDMTVPNMRTAGGHVHIGWGEDFDCHTDSDHFVKCAQLARTLDWMLGVPSVLWDKDTERRSMYGKAGAFRPKPYGMEYRVLSNAWLKSPGPIMKGVFRASMHAANQVLNNDLMSYAENPDCIDIINNSSTDQALMLTPPTSQVCFSDLFTASAKVA